MCEFHNQISRYRALLTSWRIRRKCTSCFLKHTTSCSMAFLSVLSTTRSSLDELSSCEWRFNCCRCFRCSLSEVFDGVWRLWWLSSERGLSEPFWLSGELLLFCRRRLSRRVARAGSWDLRIIRQDFRLQLWSISASFNSNFKNSMHGENNRRLKFLHNFLHFLSREPKNR